jgi:hypothetical protein
VVPSQCHTENSESEEDFRLYPGAIHAAEVIDFLGHLLRHLPGRRP